MSEFRYTTENSDSVICTGYRQHSDWRTGRATSSAYQGYYRTTPDGGYDDNRIGVIYLPGLSALKGTKINSISISVTIGSAGVHTASKNLIFRKSYINNGYINTEYTGCQYAFGSVSPSSTNADTYANKILNPDSGKTCYDYDSDILGILSAQGSATTQLDLNPSNNSIFFYKMKEYIEAGNDTFIFYNADTSRIWNTNADGIDDGTVYYSYEFLNISSLSISVEYSNSHTIIFDAANGNYIGNFGIDSDGNPIYEKALIKYEGENLELINMDIPTKSPIESLFNINGITYLDTNITQDAKKIQYFTFKGWNTQKDGSGTEYASNDVYSLDGDAILYAIYTDNDYGYENNKISGSSGYPWWTIAKDPILNTTYTVTFDGNGGTCSVSHLTANRVTKYTLDGWYSSPNGVGAKYDSDSEFYSEATIYANWVGTDTTESINLPGSDAISKEGYEFINWNSDPSGNGSAYSAGSPYIPIANTTLYAFYSAKGLVRIYTNDNKFREALVWIFDGTKWCQAMPHVFNGTEWRLGG